MKHSDLSATPDNPAKNPGKKLSGKKPIIDWHPAFIEAIQQELENFRDFLEFHHQFPLTTGPLKIDCIIIKKSKDVIISKNIALIFKEVNLLEYKGPDHNISVYDFYKVYSYACLYSYLKKVPITSLTITFVESHHPMELITHLENIRGYTVEETSPGIYNISGDIMPIQIIDNRRLSVEENSWLKNLSKKLDFSAAKRFLNDINRHVKTSRLDAYVNAITMANYKVIEEATKMINSPALEEIFVRAGFAASWEARGIAIGEARAEERVTKAEKRLAKADENRALAIAQNMINLGYSIEAIASATMLDPKKVKMLYQKK